MASPAMSAGWWSMSNLLDLTYCEVCLTNLEDEGFDYRFDFPICHQCVEKGGAVICGDCLDLLSVCGCRRGSR
jgi:hypothetical protein